jgi:hypothetical protein
MPVIVNIRYNCDQEIEGYSKQGMDGEQERGNKRMLGIEQERRTTRKLVEVQVFW